MSSRAATPTSTTVPSSTGIVLCDASTVIPIVVVVHHWCGSAAACQSESKSSEEHLVWHKVFRGCPKVPVAWDWELIWQCSQKVVQFLFKSGH
ncbi:hypothetical protein E2C01_025168 [Portunus trituberculatus]|uniref:Uncharacterized protein n=1 Tax=Portunus trituberculatus TaxID=210409 RepID=A0A5B7EF05_PORTR|nr:hypothetical protein [Portunus trituberculatus]